MFKLTKATFLSKAVLVTALLFSINCADTQAQQLKYVSGKSSWDADSLGNHRAVITVPSAGPVAKAVIEWRRKDNPANKEIIVVDARSNKRVLNIKTESLSRETGTVYFEPVSGAGTYYILLPAFSCSAGFKLSYGYL
ncbi:glycoside hydrolase domain-containing protein [Pedobacter sp. NJ-S-72]